MSGRSIEMGRNQQERTKLERQRGRERERVEIQTAKAKKYKKRVVWSEMCVYLCLSRVNSGGQECVAEL